MTKKIHIDAGAMVDQLVDLLEKRGYRYGYSGSGSCERRAAKNMPFVTIDITTGFYSGSKGADVSVRWEKLNTYVMENLYRGLPNIGQIHDMAKKNDKPKDKHRREPSKDGRKMERMWYAANGRAMGISRMKDDHLHNTILLVDRSIANGETSIGMNEDLAHLLNELEDERIHRGLHLPLIPLISLEYRKGKYND